MSRLRSFTLTAAESAEWDAGERRAPRRRAIAESRAHGLATVEIYSVDGVLLDALVAGTRLVSSTLGFRRERPLARGVLAGNRAGPKADPMSKLSLTTVATPVVKPTSKAKGAFPLDAPKKASKAAVSARVAAPPVLAAAKKAAPPPPVVKLKADVLSPAPPGAAKEGEKMLASLGLPTKGDPRLALHGAIVKGRLFTAKRGAVSVVQGPGRIPYLVRIPDGMAACAMGHVSVYWGTPDMPLNAARLSTTLERTATRDAFDLTWDELAALIGPEPAA